MFLKLIFQFDSLVNEVIRDVEKHYFSFPLHPRIFLKNPRYVSEFLKVKIIDALIYNSYLNKCSFPLR